MVVLISGFCCIYFKRDINIFSHIFSYNITFNSFTALDTLQLQFFHHCSPQIRPTSQTMDDRVIISQGSVS